MSSENKFDPIQIEGYKRMSGEERVNIALELGALVRDVARAGIREQHPEFSAEEVERELERRIDYGRSTHTAPRR